MSADKIVYVKPTKQAKVVGNPEVLVKDLAQLEGDQEVVRRLLPVVVMRLKGGEAQKVYASFLDIARAIRRAEPEITLECVGELDTVIMYVPQLKQTKKSVEFLKVALVCFVLFWGSMLTLMTFHNEASIPEVFTNIHLLPTKKRQPKLPLEDQFFSRRKPSLSKRMITTILMAMQAMAVSASSQPRHFTAHQTISMDSIPRKPLQMMAITMVSTTPRPDQTIPARCWVNCHASRLDIPHQQRKPRL